MADFVVKFDSGALEWPADFGVVNRVSDGGYESGYNAGHEIGYAEGKTDGDAQGYERGYDDGHKTGLQEGYTHGHEDGVEEGYTNGYETAKEEVLSDPQAIVDIRAGNVVSGDITTSVTSIVKKAFNATEITGMSAPNAVTIGERSFENCTSMVTADFPNVTSIGTYCFNSCGRLANINIPLLKTVTTAAFYNNASLKRLDLHQATSISTSTLTLCASLKQLIIRTDKVCTLSNPNAITGSGIANKKCLIFVPASLVESYKKATNWSAHATLFRAVEGITVDGTIMGELDEEKIATAMEDIA